RLDVAALVVERRPAQRRAHLVRLTTAVDRHAAVALFGDRVAVMAVAERAEAGVGQLVLLRLGFLQADDVGLLAFQPAEETLGRSGADAVGVEADDAHAGTCGKRRASLAEITLSAACRSHQASDGRARLVSHGFRGFSRIRARERSESPISA